MFRERNQVEVSGKYFGASCSPATVLKVIDASHFLVQYMHTENDGYMKFFETETCSWPYLCRKVPNLKQKLVVAGMELSSSSITF